MLFREFIKLTYEEKKAYWEAYQKAAKAKRKKVEAAELMKPKA